MKTQTTLKGVAIALLLIGIVWSSIVGFTLRQVPILLGVFGAAAALFYLADKMDPNSRLDADEDVEKIGERDSAGRPGRP